ncbi:MAG: hypothetical protein WBM90_01270 [Acidimicrobiia bacterium]
MPEYSGPADLIGVEGQVIDSVEVLLRRGKDTSGLGWWSGRIGYTAVTPPWDGVTGLRLPDGAEGTMILRNVTFTGGESSERTGHIIGSGIPPF